MSLLDKNKIFFALIHYILSEQKNVNWILKTSLIDFTGISSLLEEKPYKTDSILNDVIDYVVSVKPYHVQFSHYFEHYQTQSEDVIIPGNDWIEPTYNISFDNVAPEPNIKDILIFTKDMTDEEIQERINELKDGNYYFYYEQDPMEDKTGLYKIELVEDEDEYGEPIVVIKKTKISEDDFINESYANKVFMVMMKRYGRSTEFRKGIYETKDKIFDEVKKDINANFKGIEINGSVFDVGQFGYDIFDYDTEDYDSPTIIYDYYVISNDVPELDETNEFFYISPDERVYNNPVYTTCDVQRFSITNELQPASADDVNEVYIVSPKGVISLYKNAEFGYDNVTGNYLDIFRNIKLGEKVIAVNRQKNLTEDGKIIINFANVFIGVTFKESSSTSLRRQFVQYVPNQDLELLMPSSDIGSVDKISIQKREINGSRAALNPTDYEVGGNYVYIHSDAIQPGEHIVMTSFDYKYLYDKIYTWEDRYGLSNNIVNLYGDKFLRARYEADRPSELLVANPLSAVTFYKTEGTTYDVFMSDWKNDMTYTNNLVSALTKVVSVELEPDTLDKIVSITFEDTNNFEVKDGYPKGKVLINGEIIAYDEINKDTNTISGLTRGVDGTPENGGYLPRYMPDKRTTIMPDDLVLPYRDTDWASYERNNVYKSYMVEYLNQNKFICPTGYKYDSKIYITKNKKIDLVYDVYYSSSSISLNSSNVVDVITQEKVESSPGIYIIGNWTLKIDDDYIYFNKIRFNVSTGFYELSDLTFPTKYIGILDPIYKANEALIFSCIPEDIIPEHFTTQIIEGDGELKILSDGYQKKFIYIPVDNVWKTSTGISCTDNYLYFVVPEDNIIDGVIKNAFYDTYDSSMENKVTINNEDTSGQTKPVQVLVSNSDWYLVFRGDDGSGHVRQSQEYSSVPRETKIQYTAGTYDAYGYTDNGGKIFRIAGCKVDAEGKITKYGTNVYQYRTVWDDITNSWVHNAELFFGTIKKDTIYRADGTIYAKIVEDKAILVMVQVTIDTDAEKLNKGESVNITVVDKEATDRNKDTLNEYNLA